MLYRALHAACLALALWCACASAAHATPQPLDDEQLSQIWGQALLDLTNTSLNGFDFSRITLNADVQLNANFRNLRLGAYTITNPALRNGTGADIDISALQFGRSDGTDAQRLVTITDPYFEFVYKNDAQTGTREVVGMRLGFGGIQGSLGAQINATSGSLRIDLGSAGVVDSANDPLGGQRWNGSCTSCTTALSSIGALTAGDANGPSRDFFISVLKQAVLFPAINGLSTPTAGAGFWLNWRDRLYGAAQPMPPNLPKGP